MKKILLYEDIKKRVDNISDTLDEPIDESIKPLIIGLQMYGVRTTMSCGGHEDDDNERFPFPWVDVDKRDLGLLVELVQRQNRPKLDNGTVNKNRWVIMPFLADEVRLIPLDIQRSIAEMQEDVKVFGQFLQKYPED